jgi:hypothetical protein
MTEQSYKGTWRFNPKFKETEDAYEKIAEHRLYRTGAKVMCLKTFTSAITGETEGSKGETYTIRAYLTGYDYLSLEEKPGWVNASRFAVISGEGVE